MSAQYTQILSSVCLLQNLFQNSPVSYTRACAISSEADIRANVIDPRDAPSIPADAEPPAIVSSVTCDILACLPVCSKYALLCMSGFNVYCC